MTNPCTFCQRSNRAEHAYCDWCGRLLTSPSGSAPSRGSYVVYGHKIRGEADYFHIGSGLERSARNWARRSTQWKEYVRDHGGTDAIQISILERHDCPARARLREMELIGQLQPTTNTFGRSSIPPGILDGRPKGSKQRCKCGAPDCYGAELNAKRP